MALQFRYMLIKTNASNFIIIIRLIQFILNPISIYHLFISKSYHTNIMIYER